MTTRRFALGSALLALVAGLMSAPQALAAAASPSAVTVDCGVANGVTSTTITGRLGDTMTITNTSNSNACTFAGTAGVVTVAGLTGSSLPTGSQAVVTIVAAGSFTVTPTSGSPVTGTMTVVIGSPTVVPEYDVTFDANGGTCVLTSPTISVASGDWYALPTEGTGSFQCYRDGYSLAGWMRHDTLLFGGGAQQAPDVVVGNQAAAADHVMLFAVWVPLGLELTLDANVAGGDRCLDASGVDLAPTDRSVTTLIPFGEIVDYALPTTPPCIPPNYEFLGWGLTGAATGRPMTALPSQDLGAQYVTLFAMWKAPNCNNWNPGADLRGCNLADVAIGSVNLRGADLRNANLFLANLKGADLSGALLQGAQMGEVVLEGANLSGAQMPGVSLDSANLQGANLSGAQMQGASLDSANLQNANLSMANLQNANMESACVIGATWTNANVENANLSGATLTVSTPPPYVGTPTGTPMNVPDYNPSLGLGDNVLCMGLGPGGPFG